MPRVLITGAAQGLGADISRQLLARGFEVVAHARDAARAAVAQSAAPGVQTVTGRLDSLASTRILADDARRRGPYDVVIHNAALGPELAGPVLTDDGIERLLQVNVVAPYLLTALMPLPRRLILIGSDAVFGATAPEPFGHPEPWEGRRAYAESKLLATMLVFELAARHTDRPANVVHPGWLRTRMGGPRAPLPVSDGADSPVWLATSEEPLAHRGGQYVHRRHAENPPPAALDAAARARLVDHLASLTGEHLH